MKTRALILRLLLSLGLAGSTPWANAEEDDQQPNDVLFLRNGPPRAGRSVERDGTVFRLSVPLIPGQPPAKVTIPAEEVERIEFADDPAREAFLRGEADQDVIAAARWWGANERFTNQPNSPAPAIGRRYADLLLAHENPLFRQRALEIYTRLEQEAWSPTERALARQGRLRAMIATGRAAEAVEEAQNLAESSEDPAVLIEAKYILATAEQARLAQLLEDHPKWAEDPFVRPERHRLYHGALDLFLYPALFYGSEIQPAARGLWAVCQLYQLGGEAENATATAQDLVILYPETFEARAAEKFLAAQNSPEQAPADTTQPN